MKTDRVSKNMEYNKKKDFYLVTVIGFLVGWLVLLPAHNIGLSLSPFFVAASVVGFSILAPCALFILKLLGKIWGVFEQFGKFAAVGTLNTLIDLGILNLFMALTGVSWGYSFTGFKAVSFLAATTNSYFWNKLWTFQSKTPVTGAEYVRFLLFTLVGTLLNVSVASLIVNGVGVPAGISEKLWANVGALVAVAVSFMWNFISYRRVVFSKKKENQVESPHI